MSNLIKQIFSYNSHDNMQRELQEYIYSCGFLCHEESKRRIRTYIDCGCDIKKTLAALKNVSSSALRSSICHATNRINEILGINILERVLNKDEKAHQVIVYAKNSGEPLILKSAVDCIPTYKNVNFMIEDCKYEMLFLARFSEYNMKACLERIDKDKLAFLYHILKYPNQRNIQTVVELRKWINSTPNAKPVHANAFIQELSMLNRGDSEKDT